MVARDQNGHWNVFMDADSIIATQPDDKKTPMFLVCTHLWHRTVHLQTDTPFIRLTKHSLPLPIKKEIQQTV